MADINATSYSDKLDALIPGSGNIAESSLSYLSSLPSLVMQKDFFAIMISLILLYILIVLINKISSIFLIIMKKTIAFIVTILALFLIYNRFMENLSLEGLTANTIIIGLIGIVIAILGSIITFYSLFSHTRYAFTKVEEPEDSQSLVHIEEKQELDLNHLKDFKTFFSMDSLKNDKSLLSVLTFLVVAEFGVFSTKTISAPNVTAGLLIFLIFIILSFVFIRQSYRDYKKGISHIVITFTLGTMLALFLGHFWEGLPISVLLSLEVFTTDVIVALISGMALSLFAGSRNQ